MTEENEIEKHLRAFRPRAARIDMRAIESASIPMKTKLSMPYGALLGSWASGALVGAAAVLILFQFQGENKNELASSPTSGETQHSAPPISHRELASEVAGTEPIELELDLLFAETHSAEDVPLAAHVNFQKLGKGRFVSNYQRSKPEASYPDESKIPPASSLESSLEPVSRSSTRESLMRQWMNESAGSVF